MKNDCIVRDNIRKMMKEVKSFKKNIAENVRIISQYKIALKLFWMLFMFVVVAFFL